MDKGTETGWNADREPAEGRPDNRRAKIPQQPGADPFEHRLQQALIQRARPLGRAVRRDTPAGSEQGRGLQIVEAPSAHWGWRCGGGRKVVFAGLAREG